MTEQKKVREWMDNADEHRELTADAEGWVLGALIATAVEKGIPRKPSGSRDPREAGSSLKINMAEYAERANITDDAVGRAYIAWERAADEGLVPHADTLRPVDFDTLKLPSNVEHPWKKFHKGLHRNGPEATRARGLNNPEKFVAEMNRDQMSALVNEIAKKEPKVAADTVSQHPEVIREAVRNTNSDGRHAAWLSYQEAEGEANERLRAGWEESDRKAKEDRAKRHSLRWNQVSALIGKARTALREALTEAHNVEFTDDEKADLTNYLNRLQATTDLLRASITGTSGVDWDAELAKIGD